MNCLAFRRKTKRHASSICSKQNENTDNQTATRPRQTQSSGTSGEAGCPDLLPLRFGAVCRLKVFCHFVFVATLFRSICVCVANPLLFLFGVFFPVCGLKGSNPEDLQVCSGCERAGLSCRLLRDGMTCQIRFELLAQRDVSMSGQI